MEQNSNPMSSSSSLCRSGCGFYGNPSTNGLCSKCHKDLLKRKQAAPAGVSSVTLSSPGNKDSSSKALAETPSFAKELMATAAPTVQLASPSTSHEEKTCSPNAGGELHASSASIDATPSTADSDAQQKDQKRKNKCNICRRKLGLTGFQCRCGGFYCSVHRYTNEHNCTFDYKSLGAQEIQKNNPVVVAEKVKKI